MVSKSMAAPGGPVSGVAVARESEPGEPEPGGPEPGEPGGPDPAVCESVPGTRTTAAVAALITDAAVAFGPTGEPGGDLQRIAGDLLAPLRIVVAGRTSAERAAVTASLTVGLGTGPELVDAATSGARDPYRAADVLVYLLDDDSVAAGGADPVAGGEADPVAGGEAVSVAVSPNSDAGPATIAAVADRCATAHGLRQRRAIDKLAEAAAAHRHARDRLEGTLHRIAMVRSAERP